MSPRQNLKIPETLDGWTADVVRALVESRVSENEKFDWKCMFPGDDDGKNRLRRAACAFANQGGGFIVFGVIDDTSVPAERRLVGIDEKDPANRLGQLLHGQVDPPIPFTDKWLPLQDGVRLWVVELGGSLGPHSFQGAFYRRYAESAVPMTTVQVEAAFQERVHREASLRLLVLELQAADKTADITARGGVIRKINTDMLARLTAESWREVRQIPGLDRALMEARVNSDTLNFDLELMTAKGEVVKARLQSTAPTARRSIREALQLLSVALDDRSIAPDLIG